MVNVTAVISLPILPFIPGVVFINQSQPRQVIRNIMPVYYINQDKYFYLLVLHMNACILIGGITILGTGTMLFNYLKHACGMFRIAR